jgi:hypothetical protein
VNMQGCVIYQEKGVMDRLKNRTMRAVWLVALCAVLFLTVVSGSANAQVDYVLMLQQSPSNGGTVSPEAGVHNITANGAVTVVARPNPGYHFVYWLGDVSDPGANSTVVSVDAPKIVVAVFQRREYDMPFQEISPPDSIGGGGSLMPNRQYFASGGPVSPASGPARVSYSFGAPTYVTNQTEQPSQPPTDRRNDPFPVPNDTVPEPATVLLLGIGSLLALKKKE